MSDRGELQVPFNTRANQAQAADPGLSIWVSANAGSGKTFVLTRRVLRLLLAGVDPQAILCLTYTKAAAAELRGKIAAKLTQHMAVEPENRHLQRQMQRLYLAKISTVHAFCSQGNVCRAP